MQVRRRTALAIGSVVVFLLVPSLAFGATHVVTVGVVGNTFTPPQVEGVVGDDVRWFRPVGGLPHNVLHAGGLFSSGAPTDGPIDFTRRFSAGYFFYFCQVHVIQGMIGRVTAELTFTEDPSGRPFTVRWASSSTNTGNVFDVQYKVDDGKWRHWKVDTASFKGVFGRDGRPVRVRSGHTYRFRARSQKSASSPGAKSGWSPVLAVPVTG
jgi:plastocyanin